MEYIEQNFNYYNQIEEKEEILSIHKMPLNRIRLGNIKSWKNDEDIENILIQLLKDLTLSNLVNGMMICKTSSPRYESTLSEYLFYIEHLNNHLKYNEWLDKLFILHSINLNFEKHFIPIDNNINNKSKNKEKTTYRKNAFYKRQTFDLFTSEPVYEYINPKTNELIRSTNPNLAEQLNAEIAKNKPKRTRNTKSEKREKIKINKTLDFNKIKFKF